MPGNKSLNLDKQTRDDAIEEIKKLQSSTSFLITLLSGNNCNSDEAMVHMKLIRHSHDDLAKLLKTDAISDDLSRANAMCRDAHEKIRTLEHELATSMGCGAAMARLQLLEEWFQTWYQLCGWHYASTEWSPYGLKFEMSDDIEHPSDAPEQITHGDRALAVRIAPVVPYAFHNFDKKTDTFHDHILDTQANHDLIVSLFARNFPGARIFSFKSHLDGEHRLLRAEGHVPWGDIENWHAAVFEAAGKIENPFTGKLYVEKADLAVRLASRTYTSHVEKAQLREDRCRIAWLRLVTGLWEQAMGALGHDSGLSSSVTISADMPDGTTFKHKFYVGADKKAIGEWFEGAFDLDWKKDLDGGGA